MYSEEWKDWLPGFKVSSYGNILKLESTKWNGFVYQKVPEKLLSPCKSKSGYLVVNVKRKVWYVHRIVASVFMPISGQEKLDVNHIDGDKTNNEISNLEWCSRKRNINHAFEIGLIKVGEKHHSAKITEATAKDIIRIHKETGFKKCLLHKYFFPNVSKSNIQSILSGRNWKHLER